MATIRLFFVIAFLIIVTVTSNIANARLITTPFISEFHYDNTGADTGEFVEISTQLDFDLTGWRIDLYNGANGLVYNSYTFGNEVTNDVSGLGATAVAYMSGIQNSKDGIALVSDLGDLIQFISYEGSFEALEGAASGLISLDIGVEESSNTFVGHSIQYIDNQWFSNSANSVGNLNQTNAIVGVPEPNAIFLFVIGFIVLVVRR